MKFGLIGNGIHVPRIIRISDKRNQTSKSVLASVSFSGRQLNVRTFSECHGLSIVWKRAFPGRFEIGCSLVFA
jgi:hypothetical protein